MTAITGYWTMRLLCARFECSRQTIYRWMDRKENPFPRPAFEDNGINRWSIKDILEWEKSKKAA